MSETATSRFRNHVVIVFKNKHLLCSYNLLIEVKQREEYDDKKAEVTLPQHVSESGKFVLVECGISDIFLVEFRILGFGIQNTVRGIRIALTTRIRNPSSTDKESAGIQCQVSGIHGVESRVQDSLGFPCMWRKLVFIVNVTFFNRHFSSLITPYTEPPRCRHTRHQLHKK